MAEQIHVTSIAALESFRASLIVFLAAGHRSVDEVRDEVRRTRQWLQTEQRLHWEGEVRRWRRVLAQAEQELLSAKLSSLRDFIHAQEAAVLKARRALQEAEEKLRQTRIWNRDFENRVDPLLKRLEGLRHVLDFEMPKALSYLVQAQQTLDAYAERSGPAPAPSAPPPPDPGP